MQQLSFAEVRAMPTSANMIFLAEKSVSPARSRQEKPEIETLEAVPQREQASIGSSLANLYGTCACGSSIQIPGLDARYCTFCGWGPSGRGVL